MYFRSNYNNPVDNTKTVKLQCRRCNNEAENQVYEEYYGPRIGLIFLKKPLLSLRRYFLVCPICHTPAKEITKEQMQALKK